MIYVDLEVRTFISAAVSLKKEIERERVCVKCLNDPIMWKLPEYPITLYAALGIFIFFVALAKVSIMVTIAHSDTYERFVFLIFHYKATSQNNCIAMPYHPPNTP